MRGRKYGAISLCGRFLLATNRPYRSRRSSARMTLRYSWSISEGPKPRCTRTWYSSASSDGTRHEYRQMKSHPHLNLPLATSSPSGYSQKRRSASACCHGRSGGTRRGQSRCATISVGSQGITTGARRKANACSLTVSPSTMTTSWTFVRASEECSFLGCETSEETWRRPLMRCGIRTGDGDDRCRKPLTVEQALRIMTLVGVSFHTTFAERIASFS